MHTSRSAESSRRGSRAGLTDGDAGAPTYNNRRREKAKTSLYAGHYDGGATRGGGGSPTATRGAVGYGSGARPKLTSRTNSAPLVQRSAAVTGHDVETRTPANLRSFRERLAGELIDGPDEDVVSGVVSAMNSYQPFQNAEPADTFSEINIVVAGAEGVGKSTFVQKALDLPFLLPSRAAECKMPIDGKTFIVRLLELPLDDIDIYDDATIGWPDTIEDKVMPRVDGVLALYDVQDKDSVDDLPRMLSALNKAATPTVLVSCKCDTPPSERQLDPAVIEYNAKRVMKNISILQVSQLNPDTLKRGVFSLLKTIVHSSDPNNRFRDTFAKRRRAQSNAVRPVSPRPPTGVGHSRATSEHTGGLSKDHRHARHDSSNVNYGGHDHLRVPRSNSDAQISTQDSFLLEESPSETSPESGRSSFETTREHQTLGGASSMSSLTENGVTFDELVDRLLAQPTTKADTRFAAIFLALYRTFAAPGRLLEALVERFDALERNGEAQMTKTVAQLRYLAVLEQWVSTYPGDFAFPKTKRRVRTFASKLAESRIFAMAARLINNDLDVVGEDDDTNWAYSDRERESSTNPSRNSLTSSASTLIEDPLMMFKQDLSGSTLNDDVEGIAEVTTGFKLSSQIHDNVEAAQAQAELLQPIPRVTVSKIQWHALMDFPDDIIARELTRIDWTMFLSIRPRDLVRHVCLTKEQMATYKNINHVNRMIEHFNRLASWVSNYVLLRDKPKHRALMLEKFMRIARKLREMNNYNALGAIIAAIKSSSVHRLAATRELIPQSVGRDWLKLEILMAPSKSHFAYRLAWENSPGERIPYLPLHRRDLATAEEGNKTFIGDEQDGRINWKKFEIMGDVIVSLQRAQSVPYKNLGGPKGLEQIRELILDVKLVKDEEDLYERSLQCEAAANAGNSTSAKFRDFFKR